jgi:hypothetical protein
MKIEQWEIGRVKPCDKHPRCNDKAVEAVAKSIREFGFRQPIVVDKDGVIVVGHTRWKAAKKLGLAKVPVHVARDLSPEQANAYRLSAGLASLGPLDLSFPSQGNGIPRLMGQACRTVGTRDNRGRPARRPGRAAEHRRWRARADALLRRPLGNCWRGDHFVAPRSGDHATGSDGNSLLPYLPIVLGRRLPEPVRAALIAGLSRKGRFLTRFGLASESLLSPLYQADGYWRGPIWAPPMLLICDGLAECGQTKLARDLARRFCRLCRKGGFAENFDARTGRPLRDRAYTWTAGVFLTLAREYCMRSADPPSRRGQ